jgi:hypothetical protein
MGLIWFYFMYLSVPAYPMLQIVVIWRSAGAARWIAALPLVFMVSVYVVTGVAYAQHSNLWPIWLLFASPVALLYVAVVAFFVLRPAATRSPPAA